MRHASVNVATVGVGNRDDARRELYEMRHAAIGWENKGFGVDNVGHDGTGWGL